MGVPKFFRYTSERYPCLNELVKQYQIPDFDNMYLDMNGIIHNCSHPDDFNPHFRITEEKIFKDIFHYLSILFQIIKPKKLFFMAIDGVAPRAKMNQQRGRRFRSAREAEKLEDQAKAKGEVLPSEKRFDSNCITPGTVFMARLHEQLKYFVRMKISKDPLWSKVKVILSGHETPGEGEHKIMDYIRWARSQPDYDPNTRHCLYGLDADLIMLGMCTHEPHFALLREEVKFGKSTQRATSPEETNFHLLHLTLLRQYLEQEFISIKDKLPFKFDIEKVVDDWVLMGFLVGNDFIPNLPNMHISNDAVPLLYKTYMTVLPTLDGYINEAGNLNLARFEVFMQELAKIDKEKFQDTYADLKYFEMKTGRRPNANERKEYKPNNDDTFNVNIDEIKANKPDDELQALINATQELFIDDMAIDEEYDETSDEEANIEMEFILHKKDYYMNKLDYSKVTDEVLADQAEGYVRAIQWNLFYYYKGCPSWCWYYPHHYAPYISDIKGFKDLNIEFELGEPFKPFEQLLGVLPAASKHLLPTPFHDLMTDEDSPIVHYYPINFETDLNGKKNDWEAVVLIPFIDETNLLSAMSPCYQRLTEEELNRNTHGPMLVFQYTPASSGPVHAPAYFPPIALCHAVERVVWRTELEVSEKDLKRGMLSNARRDLLFPGFPTMHHLKYQTYLKKCKVKVFDQPSRNDNMIVQLLPEEDTNPNIQDLASNLLGKIIWVGWPHLTRAKVVSVSNEKMRLHHIDQQNKNTLEVQYTSEENSGNLHKQWISERSTVIEHNMNRLGIELGDVNVIIHAKNLNGYKYVIQDNVKMAMEEEWCGISCGYALQAIVANAKASELKPPTKFLTPAEAYPMGDTIFLLTQGQYYGCIAAVVNADAVRSGRIKVCVREAVEPIPRAQAAACAYRYTNHAAAACGISAQMLSRITGSVLVIMGVRNDLPTETQEKINIGLNLKFNKKNQEVSGYTRRCKVTNSWTYSERCVEVVKSYAREYPELFDRLAYTMNRDIFFEGDLWPEEVGQKKPQDIQKWVKSQAHNGAARRQCGSEALEPEEMKALWKDLEQQLKEIKNQKTVNLSVKWNVIYKPDLHEGNIAPDLRADYKMYDRIVCVARNITVPLGAKGTITAIYQPADGNTVRLSDKINVQPTYQVMFDEPFAGAMSEDLFEETRFYRMLPTNMLNISFGRQIREQQPDNVDTNPWGCAKPPAVLRRDNRQSAFASYSPPDEINVPTPEAFKNKDTNDAPKDDPTTLLRSLLKISENATDQSKQKKNTNEVNLNWRSKEQQAVVPTPKVQLQNWRKDSENQYRPPLPHNDWAGANNYYKKQNKAAILAPIAPPQYQPRNNFPKHLPSVTNLLPSWQQNPPAPVFQNNQYQNPSSSQFNPPAPVFQTNQSSSQFNPPAPVFQNNQGQNPSSSQSSQFNPPAPVFQNNQGQNPSSNQSSQFNPPAPVFQNNQGQNPSSSQNYQFNQPRTIQSVNNPFVPLQVQTSQRRAHNVSQPPRNLEYQTRQSTLPKPQPVVAQSLPIQNTSTNKSKKRKPRIAANLPFQFD